MEWEKIVGANIKRLRKERGLSQEALAGEAGLAMRHLGRIERGEGNPTVAVLGKLADVLGVRPTEFYRVS
ncbi:helix-turn-helix transcriptional regulator [Brevundimonas sp.]|jgi:transcriptional regulator with XRE-family HTH domain|uniref:helix-turn-helix domain-containing protein n=1 Tax=Brevundimonas sp. TaxID=1871086 RepID=UPI0028B12138|nr:helix-turn-helix transcriptional regulator [Brevundimonas sp.]